MPAPSLEAQRSGVAGQFADAESQHAASLLGMWAFLATEVLFFGGLFAAYAVYRIFYGDAFAAAGRRLDVVWGGINTAILIVSSAAIATAVRHARAGRRKKTAFWLAAAASLGAAFLAVKAHEYANDIRGHLMPLRGLSFDFPGPSEHGARLFFDLYFVMTGIHAIHLLIGMGLALVLAVSAWRGRFPPGRQTPVEAVGLYWHFVDAVWVFLYPLFYLIRR